LKKFAILVVALAATSLRAEDNKNLDVLTTPPPDDVYIAAKIDPKLYSFTLGAEVGWAFANPFIDDYSLGANINYLPSSHFRFGLVTNFHISKNTGLSKQVNNEIGLKDREIRFAKPELDVLAHLELRAIHGLVKIFTSNTLDYEAGVFVRAGMRKSKNADKEWNALFIPGISQTLLFSKYFNFRLLLSAELQNDNNSFVTQGGLIQGGLEWRY
jgi:hypothetical protein